MFEDQEILHLIGLFPDMASSEHNGPPLGGAGGQIILTFCSFRCNIEIVEKIYILLFQCYYYTNDMSKNENLAKNVEKLRKQKGLSQERLARLADVANNTIIKMESGENKNPTLETLRKVAKAFGVSVDDLIN